MKKENQVEEAYQIIVKDKSLFKGEKLDMGKLQILFDYSDKFKSEKAELMVKLTDDGMISIPSGRATYGRLQNELVTFINETLPKDLLDKGQSTFKPSDPSLLDELRDEEEGICMVNILKGLIRIDANCKNITESRRVALAKKQAEELKTSK